MLVINAPEKPAVYVREMDGFFRSKGKENLITIKFYLKTKFYLFSAAEKFENFVEI